MTSVSRWDPLSGGEEGPVLPRRRVKDTAEMDITPMIDITFLLLFFFMVCSTMAKQTAVKLPPARHGKGVDERAAVIITVDGEGGSQRPRIYLGDGTSGEKLPQDHNRAAERIVEAVEQGVRSGKSIVLIKAAGAVKQGDVERVCAAAGRVEGISLDLGVFEIK